ncbi:MAG: WYL domain-containing protein [Firmicutes bacterium]|nr:WYL domain-containing protein [Bacillota bacterium]
MSKEQPMSPERRMFLLLEYLKRNTDEKHPTSLKKIRNYFESITSLKQAKLHAKNSCSAMVKRVADATNDDKYEEKDWRVIYEDYKKLYGLDFSEEADEEEEGEERLVQVRKIYYNPEFSYEELDTMIEAIQFSGTLATKEANRLIRKIKDKLASRFYGEAVHHVCRVHSVEPENKAQLREKLLLIQEAISKQTRIRFVFNGYNHRKKITPRYSMELCPYYIMAYRDRYYLLGYAEGHKNASVWRIDLMTELVIEEEKPVLQKSKVKGLPQTWSDDLMYSHLNMSFDEPVDITLRIHNPKKEGSQEPEWPSYNFMMDWFGTKWNFKKIDPKDTDYDLVTVKCSPFGMVNWVLQYSDRVEVVAPEEVRDAVRERVRELTEKYL